MPVEDLQLWRLFVLACYKICSPCFSVQEVQERHVLLRFCSTFQEKYSRNRVTPNMHLHAHLKACILDYGPLCSFWLYSFKQFNGMLGSCSTNNRPVQIQIMRHFFQKQDIGDTLLPEQYRHIFQPILDKIRKDQLGTLEEQIPLPVSLLELSVGPIQRCLDWVSLEAYTICPLRVIDTLHDTYAEFLKEVYETILPPGTVIEGVTEMFERNGSNGYSGVRLGSHDSRLERSSFILASWCGNDGSNIQMDSFDLRPGVIDYFLNQKCLSKREVSVVLHGKSPLVSATSF